MEIKMKNHLGLKEIVWKVYVRKMSTHLWNNMSHFPAPPLPPPNIGLITGFHGRFLFEQKKKKRTHGLIRIHQLIFVTNYLNRQLTLPACWNHNSQGNPKRVGNNRVQKEEGEKSPESASETGEFSSSHFLGAEQVPGRGCGLASEGWTGKRTLAQGRPTCWYQSRAVVLWSISGTIVHSLELYNHLKKYSPMAKHDHIIAKFITLFSTSENFR